MKHNRLRLYVFLVLVGLLAVFASQSGATWADSGATPPIVPLVQPSATSQFNQAWQRAEKVGNYRYNTTIVQTTWPLPKLDNVGLSATEDRLYIEGETNLSAETMQMKLWSQGGNAASGQDSIEIKFEGDKAYGRVGQTDWQEMDSDAGVPTWSDLFAPDKDVLTYLQGATNIRNQGVEERAGIEFTRYTFDINGPKFAQYMRDQLQADLVSHGKLPPGLSLDLAEQYVEMQGRGELWVGQNSLPLRQVVHLKFPPAYLEQVEADITTDFSEWGDADFAERDTIGANRSPDSKSLGSMAMGYLTGLDWQKVSISAGLFAILSVLILLLISSRSRALYVGVSLTVIVSMLLTPLLQSQQVHAFYNEQQVQRNTYEAQRERQQMSREVQAELSNKDFDPHTDPLGEPAGSDQLAEGERSLSGSMDVDRLMPLLTATQIVTGTGVDSDGDGLGDADEALTCSRSDQADTDGDGLDDGTEVLELGTHPCQADSDSDLISDFIEVRGFKDESGRQWYLNPLDPDTNGDERLDSLDCSDLRNITASGQANPTSFDPPQRCADTDQDGTPDGFDFDDDNDGVPDSVDLAPTTAMGGGVKTGCVGLGEACVEPFPNQTFSFQASNLATDTPAFVDFQIRPQNPDHLWYTLNVLDWPHNDRQGQHQRVFTDTFGASGKDANGDMRLVPMLEIKIPYQAGHYNSLPVKATAPLVKPNLPTLTGKIYSDTQKLNTWLYGWLDKEATDRHGISVRVENRNGDLVVNVPLTLVRDKVGDSPVAMAGRMVYRPTDVNFGPSQQVRMVWAVYGLQDFCKPITDTFRVDLPQAERYDLWCQDTANWGTAQGVMHSYYDDWYLTGLTIQEDHGLKVGVVYENPAYQYPGQQPGYESNLWHVANGLQNTFVAGRTTTQAGVTARDITVDEIKHRFDITSTTTITERWQVPQQAMQVNVYPEPGRFAGDRYPDQSYIAEIPMTHTKTILQQYTGQAVSTTLLFVREEYYRTASLEEIGVGTKIQGVATQNSLNFNLDPAQFQQQVLAGMNWAPYHDTGAGGWKSYSIDEYWEQMDTIFNAIFMAEYPSSSPAANQGRVVLAQSFYLSLFSGASGIVQDGDNLLTLSPYKSDRDLSTSYLPAKAAGGLVKFIVKRAIKYTAEETALAAFARGEIKFGDIRHHLGTGWSIVIGVAVVAICAAIIVAATLTGGTTSEIIMSALIAIAFADAAITIVKASLAISQMQTLTNTITRASRIASIVGLIVVVAVTAGLFMYQMISASVRFGSVEFNQALAGAIATVIVATMMFAIAAIFPWGTLIVAIITVIDLLVTTICKLTDTEATKDPDDWEFWACSGINGMLTVLVQYLIYSNNPLVDLQAGGRLDIGNFSQRLITPTLGTSVGNQVAVSLDVISVLKRNKPNSWMGAVYMWHYLDDRYIEQSAFDYQLLPDKRSIDGPLSTSHTKDYWRDSSKGVVELRETVNYNNVVLGQAGINQRSALYLAEGYAINVQECFVTPPPLPPVPVCYLRDRADTLHIDVGDKLIFDIFPASLDEFYAMSDPEADGSYRLAWDSRFPALRDADGDGLRGRAVGGNDTVDSSLGADADGVVAPGATLVYSATIENDLRNRYALGLLDVDFPVAVQDESLDPQTFVLAEREQATVAG
ncbi:MAG: hypothetical protein GY832_18925, partial [Chloroflexi bacterium]|nr:hypothetical protein [Chloroflexota bacterium]